MDQSAGNIGRSPTNSLVIAMQGSQDGLPLHDDTVQSVNTEAFPSCLGGIEVECLRLVIQSVRMVVVMIMLLDKRGAAACVPTNP